jgi:hypothetical protein
MVCDCDSGATPPGPGSPIWGPPLPPKDPEPLATQVLRTSWYWPGVAHFTAEGYISTACGMDVHFQRLFQDAYATDNLCPECVLASLIAG